MIIWDINCSHPTVYVNFAEDTIDQLKMRTCMSSWSEDGTNYLQQLATCLSVLSMSTYGSSGGSPAFCTGARDWLCHMIRREQENDKRLEARIKFMQQWLDFSARLMWLIRSELLVNSDCEVSRARIWGSMHYILPHACLFSSQWDIEIVCSEWNSITRAHRNPIPCFLINKPWMQNLFHDL